MQPSPALKCSRPSSGSSTTRSTHSPSPYQRNSATKQHETEVARDSGLFHVIVFEKSQAWDDDHSRSSGNSPFRTSRFRYFGALHAPSFTAVLRNSNDTVSV